jgi:tRNA-specific 2-thiouridylase
VAEKADSQDICFVPQGSYADVVAKLRPGAAEPGNIVHCDGRVLGEHAGIIHYTVGQRRGLNLGGGEILYVVRLNADTRQVIVGPRAALEETSITVRDVNWLGETPLDAEGLSVSVKVRSMQDRVPATIYARGDGGADVRLAAPQTGVAPGQACVFYAGDEEDVAGSRVLGGGWITRRAIADKAA